MRRAARPFGLYRRPDSSVWWCRIGGVKQSTKRTDYNEAVREAARRDAEGPAVPAHRSANEASSFGTAVDRFLEAKKAIGRSDGTFDFYGKKIRHLLRVLTEDADVNAVGRSAVVDKYVNQRRAEGASSNSISKELTTLRGILKQAARDDVFAGDVSRVMPIGFDPEYTPRTRFLLPDQLDRMLAELPTNHAAAAAFMVAAACRRGDAFRAESSDLAAVPGFIRVRATKTKKNREGFRLVPVTALTAGLVKQIKAGVAGRKGRLFDTWTNVVRDLSKACQRASACKPCRESREQRPSEGCADCEFVGIVPVVTPNDLRRTHAKWLRAHGVEHGLIGDVLGHVDGRMAKRVYGQTEPEMLAAVLNERIGTMRRKVSV